MVGQPYESVEQPDESDVAASDSSLDDMVEQNRRERVKELYGER